MPQLLGDTVPLVVEEDLKQVEAIMNANPNRVGKYWIVIAYKRHSLKSFLKPNQKKLLSTAASNQMVLKRHIRGYARKPAPLQGTIVLEIDPQKGAITDTIINLPDVPVDEAAIALQIGQEQCDVAIKGDAPASSYLYT